MLRFVLWDQFEVSIEKIEPIYKIKTITYSYAKSEL